EPGGFTQQRSRARELALVLEAVRHEGEAAAAVAPDDGEEAGGPFAIGSRQGLDPALELRLGCAVGIEIGPLRLAWRAGDERLVAIEARPRPLVDEQVMEPRTAFRRLIACEL